MSRAQNRGRVRLTAMDLNELADAMRSWLSLGSCRHDELVAHSRALVVTRHGVYPGLYLKVFPVFVRFPCIVQLQHGG